MVAKTDTIWMNGELVGWDDAQVHVLAHGLHYGFGVFEGIRAYQRADGRSAIFRLGEHMQRFADSARMITLPLGYSVAELVDACVALCSSNRLRECYLRPLAIDYRQMGSQRVELPGAMRRQLREDERRLGRGAA